MPTQTMERAKLTKTVAQRQDLADRAIATEAVVPPREAKAGFRSRVAEALWRAACGFSFSGLFLPAEPAFRHSSALSYREKAWLEAYWKYGPPKAF